jgi:hypothetical protein
MPVAEILDSHLLLHGRVWILLERDHDPERVYAYAGQDRSGWAVLEPQELDEFLCWGAHEGLLAWSETSTLLSAEGKKKLSAVVESVANTVDARILTADANLRGNLLPSAAQATVRSVLNRDPGLHFIVEPDDDLEALLAAHPVGGEQTVAVLSWRRPMTPRRWVQLAPGMEPLDQYFAYEHVNSAWADAVREQLTGAQNG